MNLVGKTGDIIVEYVVNINNNIRTDNHISIYNFLCQLYFETSNGELLTILVYHLKSNFTDVKDVLKKKQREKKNNEVMDNVQ